MKITIDSLSKTERSILLYAETCLVDRSGLLESVRMNGEDHAALAKFKDAGVLSYGRIPSQLLGAASGSSYWITFHDEAWALAHQLRRTRAQRIGSTRKAIDDLVAERQAA